MNEATRKAFKYHQGIDMADHEDPNANIRDLITRNAEDIRRRVGNPEAFPKFCYLPPRVLARAGCEIIAGVRLKPDWRLAVNRMYFALEEQEVPEQPAERPRVTVDGR